MTVIRPLHLWLALLGGSIAWTGHLLMAYAIAEFGCVAGWGDRHLWAASVLAWVLMAMSVAMAALAAWSYIAANVVARQARAGFSDPDEQASAAFVAKYGRITNGLFLFVIVIESVPIFFYLGHC